MYSHSLHFSNSAIILGDNLESLPLISETFGKEKFKCVYLDPPYNDGSQVFYNPVIDSQTWLQELGVRLNILRNCLRDDGVICISISDDEMPRLRVLTETIFGRKNFVCTLIWLTKKGAQGIPRKTMVMPNHEYILVFAKNIHSFSFRGKNRPKKQFSNPDNDPRGPWKRQYLQRLEKNFSTKTIKNPENGMLFTFETPYTLEKINKWIKEKRIVFPNNSHQYPMKKEFLSEYQNQQQLTTFLGLYPTKTSTEKLNRLFGGIKIFPYSKPTRLLMDLFGYIMESDDWVIDPYAGSGTTGEAILRLNQEKKGSRKFLLLQNEVALPKRSPAYRAGYRWIHEIAKERIHRVEKELGVSHSLLSWELSKSKSNQETENKSVKKAKLPPEIPKFEKIDMSSITNQYLNVSYANLSDAQKLDIFIPEGAGPFSAVIQIHGGAFRLGDKSMEYSRSKALVENNYVAVTINYRLSGEAIFPAAVHDCKAAIRYIRANAKKYKINPEKIGVWGPSAGGNLAAMMGTSNGNKYADGSVGNYLNTSSEVQAVIDWFGPIDFSTMVSQAKELGFSPNYNVDNETQYIGVDANNPTNAELVTKANPTSYLDKNDPPFFVQVGKKDPLIPYTQSEVFANELKKNIGNEKVEFDIINEAGHGGELFETKENLDKSIQFFNKHLR